MFSEIRRRARKVGQPPGTAIYTGKEKASVPQITITTYNADDFQEASGATLQECTVNKNLGVLWMNVVGLHDVKIIEDIAKQYQLHPLTIEDILNVDQRSKLEEFDGYVFITLKKLTDSSKTKSFTVEQFSLVLGKNFVLSFQERDQGLFDNIQERLRNGSTHQRLRQQGTDYLAYRLIDVIVDHYFLVLENVGDRIEKIEERIISNPTPVVSRILYKLKRQILMLRKTIWPVREVISHLLQVNGNLITSFTQLYLRSSIFSTPSPPTSA